MAYSPKCLLVFEYCNVGGACARARGVRVRVRECVCVSVCETVIKKLIQYISIQTTNS